MHFTRRRFLTQSAVIGSLMAASPKGLSLAFADTPNPEILVVIFLRGAMDGLHYLAPVNDPNYIALRPTVRVPTTGTQPGIALSNGPAGVDMRLHGAAAPLKPIYDAGQLAFVHASGLMSSSRSHFEAQDKMELGYGDGEATAFDGWLTRHLNTIGTPKGAASIISATTSNPKSLLQESQAIAIPNLASFSVSGGTPNLLALSRILASGSTDYQSQALQTLNDVADVLRAAPRTSTGAIAPYTPDAGVTYGNSALADQLKTVAQLAKINVGLQYATIDFGGWDTHAAQNARLNTQFTQLSEALSGFWSDMAAFQGRLTIVAMTEFGRRLKENANGGTDHGHGSVFTVLGGNVNGGRIYGNWPTLATAKLDQGLDLAVTTDYRQILSELLVRRLGNTQIAKVFPTVPYRPLGLFKGTDPTPQVAAI